MIPLHPRACPGDPSRLTWVTPVGTIPLAGTVVSAPAPMAALLEDGTLTEIRLSADGVTTRLGPGRSWADAGPRVRTALHEAVEQPGRWTVSGPGAPAVLTDVLTDVHDRLEATARRLVAGPVGDAAAAHGGGIELLDVRDGVVRVRLRGACSGCPAAGLTVGGRLEAGLRKEPGFRGLAVADRDRAGARSWWRRPLGRR